jgi:hypothetical protein
MRYGAIRLPFAEQASGKLSVKNEWVGNALAEQAGCLVQALAAADHLFSPPLLVLASSFFILSSLSNFGFSASLAVW